MTTQRKSVSWIKFLILVAGFSFLPTITQAAMCDRPPEGKPWCALTQNTITQGNDPYLSNYFAGDDASSPACQQFCQDNNCIAGPGEAECNLATIATDQQDTPDGLACVATEEYCGQCGSSSTCSETRCTELSQASSTGISCVFERTGLDASTGQCSPERTAQSCAQYCFVEVDLRNSVNCFANRAQCVQQLRNERVEPGDLRFPACGCDAGTVDDPFEEGGCGLESGAWATGVGASSASITGAGINSLFELQGFIPFQNIQGLYPRNGGMPAFVNGLIAFAIGISGVVVVVMIVVGGFTYVTEASGMGKNKGKELIADSLIGLVLLLGATALLNTINPELLNLQAIEPIEIEVSQSEFGGTFGATGATTTTMPTGSAGAAVQKAIYEHENRWARGTLNECAASQRPILTEYWDNINFRGWSCGGTAWSAAFISYVTGLRAASHSTYINAAYNGRSNGWGFCRSSEHRPQVGDLVCVTRGGDSFNPRGAYKSHCDIVVSIEGTRLEMIGGNVGNTAKRVSKTLNNSGKLNVNIGILVPPGSSCTG
jgi:hypothetical protein